MNSLALATRGIYSGSSPNSISLVTRGTIYYLIHVILTQPFIPYFLTKYPNKRRINPAIEHHNTILASSTPHLNISTTPPPEVIKKRSWVIRRK